MILIMVVSITVVLFMSLSTDIPILALTAYAYASDEERILASGMNAYMSKPVNAQQLCIRIDSLLNGNVT